jgi:argininosuccinate synthase
MSNPTKKVVLAFSGGLDTSFCAVYLSKEKNTEVHAITVNTGGFSERELMTMEKHALALGATSFMSIDMRNQFYEKVIRFLVYGNILKNGTYPLSVSAERICQAIAIAEYAEMVNADAVSHGSTGAGNDQVRFDMVFNILIPGKEIITPIRDLKISREEEISYLKKHGVEMNYEKANYSINKGLWGTSVGGRETLTSQLPLPETAWPTQIKKTRSETVTLEFTEGELQKVNDAGFDHPTDAIEYLSELAAPYGIGRDIHVGDTIIGIKGRVGFEAAAPMIIIKAHHQLEKHVLAKWQLFWKDQLSAWYGNWLHEGHYLDPVMRDIEALLQNTQRTVTGKVFVTLHPQRFTIDGIESKHDLMNTKFGSYGEMNAGWSGEDVKGFTKIFGNQTSIWHKVNKSRKEEIKEGKAAESR